MASAHTSIQLSLSIFWVRVAGSLSCSMSLVASSRLVGNLHLSKPVVLSLRSGRTSSSRQGMFICIQPQAAFKPPSDPPSACMQPTAMTACFSVKCSMMSSLIFSNGCVSIPLTTFCPLTSFS